MNHYANYVRNTLFKAISEMEQQMEDFVKNPGHDFSRKGKMEFSDVIKFYISSGSSEIIASHVVLEQRNKKYEYRVNFTMAVYCCRRYLRDSLFNNIEQLINRTVYRTRSRCFQNMPNPMDLPHISILRMMAYPAQGLTARDLSA